MVATVVVSQLGARRHYAVPRTLAASGRLAHFYTDICATQGWPRLLSALPKAAMPNAVRRLMGRIPSGIPQERVSTFPGFGLHCALRRLRPGTRSDETAKALWAGRRLSELVARSGFKGASALYAFSGEALEQHAAAHSAGLLAVVDQVIAPRNVVDDLIAGEQERFPDWQAPEEADSAAAEYTARERAEWSAADLVVCPSEFVREHVVRNGGAPDRCVVVPFGVDGRFVKEARRREPGPLRVLTVGEVGLRKGSPYVVEAAQRLKGRAVFRMAGPCNVLPEALHALGQSVELVGQVPRSEMRDHFIWADVFLLPTLCEGSAMSVYEALSAGLPVVTTPNAGSVVRHGIDGFIVPASDGEAIVEALETLGKDPDRLAEMACCAAQRAADFTIEGYGQRLLAAIDRTAAGKALPVGDQRRQPLMPGSERAAACSP